MAYFASLKLILVILVHFLSANIIVFYIFTTQLPLHTMFIIYHKSMIVLNIKLFFTRVHTLTQSDINSLPLKSLVLSQEPNFLIKRLGTRVESELKY